MTAASEAPAQTEGAREAPWPSPAIAWYAVVIFALSLFVNFMDRGIVNLLVQPIEHDLHLGDFQFSMLTGLPFAIFYAVLAFPIARLVDSKSRRTIMTFGLFMWGLATSACGVTRSFGQLFSCRIGVGVGEACTGPATYSLLADLFPPTRLPRAIAGMNAGYVLGAGLAAIGGGAAIAVLTHVAPWRLPIVGTMRAWQEVFFIVGIPGFIVALMMLTVPEPARRGGRAQAPSVREVAAFLSANRKTYGPMYLGIGLQTTLVFGSGAWAPAFFMRHYGWTAPQFAYMTGILTLCIMPFGIAFGAWLAERWARKGHNDANMRVVVLASALAIPGSILLPLMPVAGVAVAITAFNTFVGGWVLGPQNAALQVITPNQMRGQVSAIFLFIFNVIGFALGPMVVGALTTYVFRNPAALNYSLVLSAAVFGPAALLVLLSGLKAYGESFARSQEWN